MPEYYMGQAVDVLLAKSGWTPGIYRGMDSEDGTHRVLLSLNGPLVVSSVHGQHIRHRDDHDRVRSKMIDDMIVED
jgi:hypothetical protein